MIIIQILLLIGNILGAVLFYSCDVTTTGQINQKGNYQFKIIRNGDSINASNYPQQLYTTYYMQIDFPWTINSDYICYNENLIQTSCTYSSNQRAIITSYFAQNYLNADYSKENGFEFLVNLDSVMNPSYSGNYDQPVQISFVSSSGVILEQCPNNGVYPSVLPGTGICTGDGQQSKISSTNANVALTIVLATNLTAESYLMVQYTQYWQNDKVTKEIIPGTIQCNIYANNILISGTTCTKDSTNLQIKSTIGAGYSAAYITLVISGINSPSSTKPVGSFTLKTYNSNNKQIDQCSTSTVGGWASNVVVLNSMAWTSIVNQIDKLSVIFQLNSQILISDTIVITIPKEISTSSSILTQIKDTKSYFFSSSINNTVFDLSNNVVTITSAKAFSSPSTQVTLTFYNVIAPPSIKPTSTISISTYRDTYIMDQSTTSLTISATYAALTSIKITAKNKVINQLSDYDFAIQLTNPLLTDGYLVIQFPTQFDLTSATTITNYIINSQSYSGALSKSGQNLIISSLYSGTIAASSSISFTVKQIKNQFSANISNAFSVQTFYSKSSEDYLVDQLTNYKMESFTSGSLDTNSITVKAENYITGTQDNYDIDFTNTNAIAANGYIIITIVSDITISGSTQSCLINNVASTCSQISTQTIKIISANSIAASTAIKIQIKQFLINCSTLKSLTNVVTLQTYDDQGLLIDSGTGGSITMLYLSKFGLTLQNKSSSKNGDKSIYTFKINFLTNQINGIYVIITFPSELTFDLSSCSSSSPLNSIIPCSVSGQIFQIQLNCNTCAQITANTDYVFTIAQLKNYYSFKPFQITDAYSIQNIIDLVSKQSQLKDSITISNSVVNSIKTFSQNYENGYLQQLDNYSFTISLTNSLINQFKIIIVAPTDIKVQQSTDATPSTISNLVGLPNDITTSFSSQNIIITGTLSSSVSSIQLQINNLMNPSTTTISGYFQISTFQVYNNQDYAIDTGQLGTYVHKCTLPCKDCDSSTLTKCSSCYDTARLSLVNSQIYFMSSENNCIADCYSQVGYFVVSGEFTCSKCNDECKTCRDTKSYCLTCSGTYKFLNNQCLTDCPVTYYNDSLVCKKCVDNCDKCTIGTSCTLCSANYYLYQSLCTSKCPSDITIQNGTQQTCDNCTNNCKTCQTTTDYCLSCVSSYYLYQNACSKSCKDSTYISGTSCIDCQTKCKTCSSGTTCDTCQPNLLFFQNDCIDKCQDQYYAIDGKCQQCNVSCYTCETTQYKCTSCVNNTFLYSNQCLGQCPDEYYNDLNTNKCQSCVKPCKTCKSTTACLSCVTQTPILYYYNNSCNTGCLENYAPENGQCVQCRNPCKQCTLTPDTCSECYPNTYLLNSICVTDCGDGFYQDSQYFICRECSTNCKTCKTKNITCLSCNGTQSLFKSTCVDDCGDGYYSQDQICNACLNICSTCTDGTSCKKCKDNLISYNNECLTQCPTNLFKEDNTCVACRSPCISCSSSPDTCLACVNGTFLDSNQKCITDCGDGYYGDQVSGKCLQCVSPCLTCNSSTSCKSCVNQTPILYFYNNSCHQTCLTGYAPENNVCTECRSPCKNCDTSPDSCSLCVNSTYLLGKSCNSECGDGYFGDSVSGTCEKCISPCLTCSSLTKCNSCIKTATNNIYYNGECISACKSGYYEQDFTCVQCTESSTNSACTPTVELIESIQSERFIPMPCTILTLVFIVTVIVAKIHRSETFIPGAISSFGGLFEWGSHCVLLYLSYLEWGLFNYQNFVIMGAVGVNYFLNIVHLIVAKCIFHKDASFQQWMASRMVNKFTYCIITFMGLITTFKLNKIVFSRYFGFYFFKARIGDVKELISFNIISVFSIIFTELPMVVAGVMILNFHDTKDQLYVSAIDCIIVSFIILIVLIWEAQKDEEYFQENIFQALNQSVQQNYRIDQSGEQQQQNAGEAEQVLNNSASVSNQQIVEATNIQSTNNQKKKLLAKNKSDVIFHHKSSSVVPEDDPFFKTQNNESQSSAKKEKFEEFLKQRTKGQKNSNEHSLNLSSISQDEHFNHPLNETSQDKDLFQDYQMLSFQNPEQQVKNCVINDSHHDSNFSSELEFNNQPTNQLNTPQNKTSFGDKFKKKNKTIEIITVDDDNNGMKEIEKQKKEEEERKRLEEEERKKLQQEEEERKRLQKEEEDRLIQQKIEEEKQRIKREEEQKLELFKQEQLQKEEMYQEQLRQIQLEKEKMEEQKRQEELLRIQECETQRKEKEKILEQEKLLKSQIDEQMKQRKLQEQREFELQKLLEKEKEERILFQQQLNAKLQREEEFKKLEEERKLKEKEEMERLEQIKLELQKKEEQQLLELKLKEQKIQKEKEQEIEKLRQELILQQEQMKMQKLKEEERLLQEQTLKQQKEKEEWDRINKQKEEIENQRRQLEEEEQKQKQLQIALELQRQKEIEQAFESQRLQEEKFQQLLREKEEVERKAQGALLNQQKLENEQVEIINNDQNPEAQQNSSFDEINVDEQQEQKQEENQQNFEDEFQLIAFDDDNEVVDNQKEKKKMFLQIQISDDEDYSKKKKKEYSIQEVEEDDQFNFNDLNTRNQITDYSKQIDFGDPQDQFKQKISSKSITVQRSNNPPQKINKTIQDYSRNKLEQSSQYQFQPKKTQQIQQNLSQQNPKFLNAQKTQGSMIGQQSSKIAPGITPSNRTQTHYNFQGTAYNSFAPKTTVNKEKDDKYLRQKEEIYLQHIPNYYEKQVQDEIKKKKLQQQRKNLKSSQHNKFEINEDSHLEF